MIANDKRVAKLTAVLERLRGGKIVQRRQLKTLLGDEGYARFNDDWRQQQELREELKDKPNKIIEYEQRLKEAMFAYNKADAASRQGRRAATKTLFGASDTLFERLLEFLTEQIAGDYVLERWLDRNVHFDASNAPIGSPDDFPRVITSRSLSNGSGYLTSVKQTINEVKISAVERALEELTAEPVDVNLLAKQLAARQKRFLMD